MRYPLQFIRIFLTIVLTLVIGVLPHHHHHGEPCWVVDVCEEHQHEGETHGKDCPSDPCGESTCYLNSMKTFIQAERPNDLHPMLFSAILPEELQFDLPFISSFKPEITLIRYLYSSAFLRAESRRGPPSL